MPPYLSIQQPVPGVFIIKCAYILEAYYILDQIKAPNKTAAGAFSTTEMSYFNGPSPGNHPLSFPSYNVETMRQSNLSNLNPVSNSMAELLNQYSRSNLNNSVRSSEGKAADGNSDFVRTKNHAGLSKDSMELQKSREAHEKSKSNKNGGKQDRRNRPGHKFGAKKRLWVWMWFVQDLVNQNIAVCDFCGKVITRVPSDKGLPKKLSEHLHTHKLTKSLINTSRTLAADRAGLSFNNSSLQIHNGPFLEQSEAISMKRLASPNSLAHSMISSSQQPHQLHPNQRESLLSLLLRVSPSRQLQHETSSDSIAPELKECETKYRSIEATGSSNSSDMRQLFDSSQDHSLSLVSSAELSMKYRRGDFYSRFESSDYSVSKFHSHLLKFLAENKLSIRLLKLNSFQQLIYDLRPDSLNDLLDLTGLYSSFVEVSRVDEINEAQNNDTQGNTTAPTVNVVNTHEFMKK